MNTKTKINKLKKEVVLAYADCNRGWEEGEKLRNLNYISTQPVDKNTAVEIMTAALGLNSPNEEGYNSFCPIFLKFLPEESMVYIAREGSVCVYVDTDLKFDEDMLEELRLKMNADEIGFVDGQLRIWWD